MNLKFSDCFKVFIVRIDAKAVIKNKKMAKRAWYENFDQEKARCNHYLQVYDN